MAALAQLSWARQSNAVGVSSHNRAYAPQPNKSFNADANTAHSFAILLASVGALRPYGLRRRLPRAVEWLLSDLPNGSFGSKAVLFRY